MVNKNEIKSQIYGIIGKDEDEKKQKIKSQINSIINSSKSVETEPTYTTPIYETKQTETKSKEDTDISKKIAAGVALSGAISKATKDSKSSVKQEPSKAKKSSIASVKNEPITELPSGAKSVKDNPTEVAKLTDYKVDNRPEIQKVAEGIKALPENLVLSTTKAINQIDNYKNAVTDFIGRRVENLLNKTINKDSPITQLATKLAINYAKETVPTRRTQESIDTVNQNLSQAMQENVLKAKAMNSGMVGDVYSKGTELASSLGSSFVGLAGTAVNPILGTTLFMISAGGDYLDDAKERGMDDDHALLYATIMGGMEGITENVITKGRLKNISLFKTKQFEKLLESFGIDMLENAIQEAVIEPISEESAYIIGGENAANFEGLGERTLQAGIDGALSEILFMGIEGTLGSSQRVYDKIKNNQTPTKTDIKQMIEDAQKSGINVQEIIRRHLEQESNTAANSAISNNKYGIYHMPEYNGDELVGIQEVVGTPIRLEDRRLKTKPALVYTDEGSTVIDSETGTKLINGYTTPIQALKSVNDMLANLSDDAVAVINNRLNTIKTNLELKNAETDAQIEAEKNAQQILNETPGESAFYNENDKYSVRNINETLSQFDNKKSYTLDEVYEIEEKNYDTNTFDVYNPENKEGDPIGAIWFGTDKENNLIIDKAIAEDVDADAEVVESITIKPNKNNKYSGSQINNAIKQLTMTNKTVPIQGQTDIEGNIVGNKPKKTIKAATTKNVAKKATTKSDTIQGLEGHTREEIKDIAQRHIQDLIDESGEAATINGLEVIGSRNRGDARADSDLDIVVEYSGDMREDDMFNMLNKDPLEIEGIKVDINPINKDKSGTLKEYLEKSQEYDKMKQKEEVEKNGEEDTDAGQEASGKHEGENTKGEGRNEGSNGVVESPQSKGLQNYQKQQQEKLGKDFRAELVPSEKQSKYEKIVRKGFKEATGLDINVYKTNISTSESAFYNAKEIFLKENSLAKKKSVNFKPYHEFGHWLKENRYETWERLYEIVNKTITQEQINRYKNVLNDKSVFDGMTKEQEKEYVANEIVSDYIGNWANDIGKWKDILPFLSEEYQQFLADIAEENEVTGYNVFGSIEQQEQMYKEIKDIMYDMLNEDSLPFSDRNDVDITQKNDIIYVDDFEDGELNTILKELRNWKSNYSDGIDTHTIDSFGNHTYLYLKDGNKFTILGKVKDFKAFNSKQKIEKYLKELGYESRINKQSENNSKKVIRTRNTDRQNSGDNGISTTRKKSKSISTDNKNKQQNISTRDNDRISEVNTTIKNSKQSSFIMPKNVKDIKNMNKFLRDAMENEADKVWKQRLRDAYFSGSEMIFRESPLQRKRELVQQYLDYKNNIEYSNRNDVDNEGRKLTKEQQEYFKDSKVRDENGNLLTVYKGVPNGGFTVFDKNKTSRLSITSQYGTGFYFTNSYKDAKSYTYEVDVYGNAREGINPIVYEAYLNIKNPFVIKQDYKAYHNLDRGKLKQLLLKGDNSWFFDNWIPFYLDQPSDGVFKEQIEKFSKKQKVELYLKKEYDLFGDKAILEEMHRAYKSNEDLINNFQKIFGYDGIVVYGYNNINQYIAFNAEQIKNVNNKKPTNNPDIRYSDRSDTDNEGRELTKAQQERYKDVSNELRDEQGRLKRYYHGTQRGDRVGNIFDPNKATSGPMAFFTDSKEIATSYSENKKDTSLSRDYENEWDLFKANNMDLNRYWRSLTYAQQQKMREKGSEIGFDDDYELRFAKNASKESFGGHYEWKLKTNGNNALEALYDTFINSGYWMGEDMANFLKVLDYVGAENVTYLDPYKTDSKVYEVYLNIKNPFNTENISKDMIKQFEQESKQVKFNPEEAYSADMWDKTNVSPEQWIERLHDDIKNGETHAWTAIPEWVTDVLKQNGYDGIVDTGGKNGGVKHQVVIPFYSNQIKNIDNKNPTDNPDIRYSNRYDTDENNNYGFYSQLEKVIEDKMPNAANVQQIRGILNGAGIKQDELNWIGLDDYLKSRSLEKISKQDILDYIKANQIHIETVTKGFSEMEEKIKPIEEDIKYHIEAIKKIHDKYHMAYEEYDDDIYYYRQDGLHAGTIGDYEVAALKNMVDLEDSDLFEKQEDGSYLSSYSDGVSHWVSAINKEIFENDMQELADLYEELHEAQMNLSMIKDEYGDYVDELGVPKYKQYTLEGGTNYQEKLYTVPKFYEATGKNPRTGEIEQYAMNKPLEGLRPYESPHWSENNVVAHVRTQDFQDTSGNKVLFIDEIQSDMHQEGRKKGYASIEDVKKRTKYFTEMAELKDEYADLSQQIADGRVATYAKASKERTNQEEAEYNYRYLMRNLAGKLAEANNIGFTEANYFLEKLTYTFENPDYSNLDRLVEDIRQNLALRGYKLASFTSKDIKDFYMANTKLINARYMYDKKIISLVEEYNNSKKVKELLEQKDNIENKIHGIRLKVGTIGEGMPEIYPFKKNWHEFVLRRMINDAVQNGYDEVAWTTGRQQRERYNLAKVIDSIEYYKPDNLEEEGISISAYKGKSNVLTRSGIMANELADYVGKDIAMQILNSKDNIGVISNLDETINENPKNGMYLFYDQEIPAYLNKYLKKWNSKVETITLKDADGKAESKQPGFKITDEMREAVKEFGQPLYADRVDLEEDSTEGYTEEQKKLLEEQRKERLEVANMIKQRSFYKNVYTSDIPKEMRTTMKKNKEMYNYTPISNQTTLDKANKMIDGDYKKATADFYAKDKLTKAEDTAIGDLLIKNAIAKGDYKEANLLSANLAAKLTEAGQIIQAASLFKRMTPEGMIMFAQKQIEKINEELNKKYKIDKFLNKKEVKIQLTDEKIAFINGMMEEMEKLEAKKAEITDAAALEIIERQQDIILAKIMAKIGEDIPLTNLEKLAAWRNISLLLNLKTIMRNLIGNTSFGVLENITDTLGVGLDQAVSLVTGERSLMLPNLKTQAKGLKKGLNYAIEDSTQKISTSLGGNKYEIKPGDVFKNPILNKLQTASYFGVEGLDRPFMQAKYESSLEMLMKLEGLKYGKDLAPEDLQQEALEMAKYATFKNKNIMSDLLGKLRRGINQGRSIGAADVLGLTYTNIPGNLTMKAIDYSPVGLYNVFKAYNDFKTKKLGGESTRQAQRQMVQSASRVLIGSGIMAISMRAFLKGILTASGDDEDDKVEALINQENYAINVSAFLRWLTGGDTNKQNGDLYVTYSNYEPLSSMIAAAADMVASAKEGKDSLTTASKGLKTWINTMMEMSTLSNFSSLFEYGDTGGALTRSIYQFPSSFIPTFAKQIAQYIEPNSKSNYSDNEIVKNFLNPILQRIPGLSKTLENNYDTFGEPKKNFNDSKGLARIYDVFLNTSFTSTTNMDEVKQELYDLYLSTGSTDHLPIQVKNYFTYKGEKITLTAKEKAEYQKEVGQRTAKAFKELMNTSEYKNMSDAAKVKKLSSLKNEIIDEVKGDVVLEPRGLAYETKFSPGKSYLQENKQQLVLTKDMQLEYEKVAEEEYNRLKKQGLYTEEKMVNSAKSKAKKYMMDKYKSQLVKAGD